MSYQHILVPVDDSELSEIATRHALFIAQAFGSRVTVMSVVAVDPFVGVDFYKVAPLLPITLWMPKHMLKSILSRFSNSFSHIKSTRTLKSFVKNQLRLAF